MEAVVMMLAAAAATAVSLRVFLLLAPRVGLVSTPGAHRQHQRPTPVGAGVAIAVGVLVGALALAWLQATVWRDTSTLIVLVVSLALVGLIDDRFHVASLPRLLVYAAVSCVWVWTETAWPLSLTLLAGLALVWVINLFNFMDGLDGFAALQCVCVCVGMALLASFGSAAASELGIFCLVVAVCSAVFLTLNWPPASVFMGDAGAVVLGALLGMIGLWATLAQPRLGWAWLVLMMPFVVDASLTLLVRLWQRLPPHVGHRDHAYQRLHDRVGDPRLINVGLLALHLGIQFPLAVTVVSSNFIPLLLVIFSAIPTVVLLVWLRRTP